MKRFKILFFVSVLIGFAALAYAGFNEAKDAYDTGDFAKAYKEIKELAEQGTEESWNNVLFWQRNSAGLWRGSAVVPQGGGTGRHWGTI